MANKSSFTVRLKRSSVFTMIVFGIANVSTWFANVRNKLTIVASVIFYSKPTISIVTPFYNGGKTLIETANGLFSQTYPYFEWIIVDDGSKDKESLKKA